ncbi:uncharacterized protein LAESUDRAFT_765107 [Laetiporus sulphureus 93-53]|uniref:Uncharacterized protein n=1 Tax=Laetiporus sulphureus 93-53 TaxID=1314785 RepID=A0A165AYF3_9APHY|nr:uncharacterized protein LAESUDRAFT_765107 [Laetiporus sulphureus 93-53]KZS99894.1 hypothetical protein LAESUDRAFT_765107 [Laetiporus sulphureus 93-53]
MPRSGCPRPPPLHLRNGHNAPATKPLCATPRRRSDVPALPHCIYVQWPQCASSDQALVRDLAACYPGVVVSSPASLVDGVPMQATQAMHATTTSSSRPPHLHNPPPFAHVSCPPALPPSTNTSHQHLSPAILTSLPSLRTDLTNAPVPVMLEPPYVRTDDEKDECRRTRRESCHLAPREAVIPLEHQLTIFEMTSRFAHLTASSNNVVHRRKTLGFIPVLPHSIYCREPLATRCVPASSVSLPTHTTWHSTSSRTSSPILLRPASFVICKDSSVKARLAFVQVPQGESTAYTWDMVICIAEEKGWKRRYWVGGIPSRLDVPKWATSVALLLGHRAAVEIATTLM